MAAPFEDKVIEFIGSKRPLKLLFLTVAGLGIFSSAYKTVQPAIDGVRPSFYRLFDVKLERADRQKYECAYFSGGAQWNIPAASRLASSLGPEAVRRNLTTYQGRLSTCLNALGYSTPSNWSPISSDVTELEKVQITTIGALNSFAGSLQAKDRLTYLIHQIGNDAAFVLTQLEPSSPDERLAMTTALLPYEADIAKRLTESLMEARKLCPCKLPTIELRPDDRKALLEYSRKLDEAMTRLLVNEP